MAATPEQAITARLTADAGVGGLVGGRVYPQEATQEPTLPAVVYERQGGDGRARLAGGTGGLRSYLIRLDCYGATEAAAAAVLAAVDAALDGWRDPAAGVQGVFLEDTDSQLTERGVRVASRTVRAWHKAT